MSDTPEAELDWVHPPPGIEAVSLWGCVYDARLNHCQSHLWERSLTFEFRSGPLEERLRLPEGWTFQFHFSKVHSLRVLTDRYPDHPKLADYLASGLELPPSVINALTFETRPHCCSESVSWSSFELAFAREGGEFRVRDAQIIQRGTEAVALRLSGFMDDNEWRDLIIQAEALTLTHSDTREFSLDELMAMGEAYWEDFGGSRSLHGGDQGTAQKSASSPGKSISSSEIATT